MGTGVQIYRNYGYPSVNMGTPKFKQVLQGEHNEAKSPLVLEIFAVAVGRNRYSEEFDLAS